MKSENKINIFKTQSGRIARTISGWKKLPQDRTTVEGTSMTVPNMAYEIKDLLTNYSRGIDLLNTNIEPDYDENPNHEQADVSAINRMDIQEQTELIGYEIARAKELQGKIQKQIDEAKKQALAQPLASSKVENQKEKQKTTKTE